MMERYTGQELGSTPRIAVIANDALGNFAVSTPLLQMLHAKHPGGEVHYYGGMRTREMELASDLIDGGFPLHHADAADAEQTASTGYDWVINVENSALARGFAGRIPTRFLSGPVDVDGNPFPQSDDEAGRLWDDPEWISESLTQRFPSLRSGFIAEIFCRGCGLEGPIPAYRLPSASPEGDLPDVWIAMSASLPEKLWPASAWSEVLRELKVTGKRVGLLGAKPSAQSAFWKGDDAESMVVQDDLVEDWRGAFTLPQVVGALSRAKACLTLDNGILHFAVAAGTPTVGLYRWGIHRLWAPPVSNLSVVTPEPGEAVATIPVRHVTEALAHVL